MPEGVRRAPKGTTALVHFAAAIEVRTQRSERVNVAIGATRRWSVTDNAFWRVLLVEGLASSAGGGKTAVRTNGPPPRCTDCLRWPRSDRRT